jgi:hypothetical protein
VRVVATEASDAARVHQALHKIVALHAILMRRAVGEMGETGFAQFVLFQLPIVRQLQSRVIAYCPVVILALDGIGERLALGMALDASVIGLDEILPRRIENIEQFGIGGMVAES